MFWGVFFFFSHVCAYVLKSRFCYIALADLVLTMKSRLNSNLRKSPCFNLLSSGITGMTHNYFALVFNYYKIVT